MVVATAFCCRSRPLVHDFRVCVVVRTSVFQAVGAVNEFRRQDGEDARPTAASEPAEDVWKARKRPVLWLVIVFCVLVWALLALLLWRFVQ
jgi:hypothetical protein